MTAELAEFNKRQEATLKYFGTSSLLNFKDTFSTRCLNKFGMKVLETDLFTRNYSAIVHGENFDIAIYNNDKLKYLGNGVWDVEKREKGTTGGTIQANQYTYRL